MLSLDQALACYREQLTPAPAISLPLADALGQILAQDLRARLDLPPMRQSAMDGYALAASTINAAQSATPVELPVAFTIPAGISPAPLPAGHCARIMTGAALPAGADSVVIQENVRQGSHGVRFSAPVSAGANVRQQGEELRSGAAVLRQGSRLGAQQLALAATAGHAYLPCTPPPRCAILVTGDELIAPGMPRSGAQIYESNGIFLQQFLREQHLPCARPRRCGDDLETLSTELADALKQADLVLITGGASVGDFDFSRAAAARCGVREVFWKVKQKPGKPLSFGLGPDGQAVLILPGNPGSVYVCAQVHLRAVLHALRGQRPPEMFQAALDAPVTADSERDRLLRMRLQQRGETLRLSPLPRQASHMISNLAETEVIVHVPAGRNLPRGHHARGWHCL